MSKHGIARIVLALVVVAAILGFGAMAYNAGLGYGMMQAGHVGDAAVAGGQMVGGRYWGGPYVGGPMMLGFGFLGLFGVLFKILFFFGFFFLLSRLFFWGGPGRHMRGHWQDRAKGTFDEWHRKAHEGESGNPGAAETVVTPQS